MKVEYTFAELIIYNMADNYSLENVLCLDIETVPQYKNFDDCPDALKKLWLRKAEFLKKGDDDTEASVYPRAGIYAEFGKVICISTGFMTNINGERQFRLKSFSGDDEAEVLIEFAGLLKKLKPGILLCAHNGKEFDFPYLSRRMVVNRIPIPPQLDNQGKKPWEIAHLDTMEMWKFGDYKNYTPLNLLAYILGIPSPKDDIDGSQVGTVYWEQNDLKRIVTYCQKDVVTVMQILLRLKNKELLSDGEIHLT